MTVLESFIMSGHGGQWIPASAGMTVGEQRNTAGNNDSREQWIPASAGMTVWELRVSGYPDTFRQSPVFGNVDFPASSVHF